jgi:DNA-binding beta-propeller fold protein YncE
LAAAVAIALSSPVCTLGFDSYEFLYQWGTFGAGDGQFDTPIGMLWMWGHPLDIIYVVDSGNHRVQKFSEAGDFLGKWGTPGSGEAEFSRPTNIAQNPFGYLYVTDTGNNRVQKFTETGDFVLEWGSPGTAPGQFDSPAGIEVDGDGYVYVADLGNHRIQRFTAYGQFVDEWGGYGSGEGQFNEPSDVVLSLFSDEIVVVDALNNRLQVFNMSGVFLYDWKWSVLGGGELNAPRGAVFGECVQGDIILLNCLVADTGNHGIASAFGCSYLGLGSHGSGAGQFSAPQGVATDYGVIVWVADTGNHRVQVFEGVIGIEQESWGRIKSRYLGTKPNE